MSHRAQICANPFCQKSYTPLFKGQPCPFCNVEVARVAAPPAAHPTHYAAGVEAAALAERLRAQKAAQDAERRAQKQALADHRRALKDEAERQAAAEAERKAQKLQQAHQQRAAKDEVAAQKAVQQAERKAQKQAQAEQQRAAKKEEAARRAAARAKRLRERVAARIARASRPPAACTPCPVCEEGTVRRGRTVCRNPACMGVCISNRASERAAVRQRPRTPDEDTRRRAATTAALEDLARIKREMGLI